ncbi:MAG: hypothetical protein ABWW70_05290 [Thermoproteota archaeon]
MPPAKKLVAVPADIVDELARVLARSGLSLSEGVSMLLSYAARTLQGRSDIPRTLTEAIVFRDAQRLGAALVPLDVLGSLIAKLGREEALEVAAKVAKFWEKIVLAMRARETNVRLSDVLSMSLPGASVDDVPLGDGEGRIVIVLPEEPHENVLMLVAEVARRVVSSWGLEVRSLTANGSLVVVEYSRR